MQATFHLTLKFISYLLSRNSGKDYSSFPDWMLSDIAQVNLMDEQKSLPKCLDFLDNFKSESLILIIIM